MGACIDFLVEGIGQEINACNLIVVLSGAKLKNKSNVSETAHKKLQLQLF